MNTVDRGDFCSNDPYEDCPQQINYSATISAPHMHAYCLEWLNSKLTPGSKVLDVGSGSGYLCAAFYEMVKNSDPGTQVVGIEHIEPLAQLSVTNLQKSYSSQLESGKIKIICGDGRLGYIDEAPYDAIHVGAAAKDIPADLIEQLKVGGQLVIPVGKNNQEIVMITKLDEKGNCKKESLLGVRYVPLTDKESQCPNLYRK